MLTMRRGIAIAALLTALGLASGSAALAVEVKHAGKLQVPANVALVAFSTDPAIQQVLTQDIEVAKRNFTADSHSVLTLTVSVADQALRPGVSLGQLAPGDPDVGDLLKAVGVTPPPIGDTGTERDEAGIARRNGQSLLPSAGSPLQRSLGDYTGDTQEYLQQGHGQMLGGTHRDDAGAYDTIIVARASLNGKPEELTVVAVVHPGEDERDAKKLVAEEIANAVLH